MTDTGRPSSPRRRLVRRVAAVLGGVVVLAGGALGYLQTEGGNEWLRGKIEERLNERVDGSAKLGLLRFLHETLQDRLELSIDAKVRFRLDNDIPGKSELVLRDVETRDGLIGLLDPREHRQGLEGIEIRREGSDVTVLAYGTMVHVALAAAEETGVDAEVIDLRTLLPLDTDTIMASVKKTGRCVIVHEATLTCGYGAELAALVQRDCFYHLEAPIIRVTGWDTPYPHAQEWAYFPGPDRVGRALTSIMEA